ncbi:MAG: class I adenylate-forming enzyme family protein [Mycobacterium sp.]
MLGPSADGSPAESFAIVLAQSLADYGDRPFIEFERKWYSGHDIAGYQTRIDDALDLAGVGRAEPVGVVVRNRVPHAAAVLGFVASGRPLVMIYSYQSASSIGADVESLGLAAVLADRADWTDTVLTAARRAGTATVAVSLDDPIVELLTPRVQGAAAVTDPSVSQPGIHILTSGTTGAPKRVPITTSVLSHTVFSITHGQDPTPEDPPDVVFWPFGSIGVCQLLAAAYTGKRMVLLERFTVDEWVRAVKTYRIRRSGAQPALVRMLLDADVDRADLASLEYLVGGSGPLEHELREEFEHRYGIPVLWAYGATEFAGSVCAWTPELRDRYGASKPDSSGRPLPGVHVRIVDSHTGCEVANGEKGFLEARVDVMGPEWIRTTDLASIDLDGFVTLHGRGDGAINRGGFKVIPETVRRVLVTHPAVRDACVVGVADRRLGEVPFAAVELRLGATPPSESELKDLIRESLPSHHVPVAIATVDELPRNAAMKVRPSEVAELYRP